MSSVKDVSVDWRRLRWTSSVDRCVVDLAWRAARDKLSAYVFVEALLVEKLRGGRVELRYAVGENVGDRKAERRGSDAKE